MRAIQVTELGGPEVLRLVDLPAPQPAPGQLLVEVDHAGVNYADTHQTEDSYLTPANLPLVPGGEVVGRGPDGRRLVALTSGGGYAELALATPALAFEVPDDVTDGQAQRLGADVAIDGTPDGLAERIRAANGGHAVDVVLEMVGGPTFDASLHALGRFGRLACYGKASRVEPSPLRPVELMVGSKTVAEFWLVDCTHQPELLAGPMAELMELTRAGRLRPVVGPAYPLAEAARAHQDLRARRTTGKVVLAVRQ